MDNTLTPKWPQKHPKKHTLSLANARSIDNFLEPHLSTLDQLHLDLGCFLGIRE